VVTADILPFLLVTVGFLLLVVEFFLWSFVVFPIGFAFIALGFALLFHLSRWAALALFFGVASAGYTLSFIYLKRLKGKENLLEELRTQQGVVISRVDEFTYLVRFPLGAGGEEVWNAYCERELKYGDRVRVVGLKGNKLLVEKEEDA